MNKFGTAIILAGGKSSRMGFDKQFLKINEKRLINIIINKLEEEFDEIIIVTNKPEAYNNFNEKILADIIKGMGPLGGIHSGLKESSSEYAFIIACDMPNINIDYIKYMKKIIKDEPIDVCTTYYKNYIEPFHGFYSREIVKDIENYLIHDNRRSIYDLVIKLNTYYIKESKAREYSFNWDMFSNLNTEEELKNYLLNRERIKKEN